MVRQRFSRLSEYQQHGPVDAGSFWTRNRLRTIVQLATQVYEDQLWGSRRAQDYLRSRAVPEEVARTQRLGYADGHTLLHHLEGAGHDPQSGRPYIDVAQDLGLVLSRPPEWGAGPPAYAAPAPA